MIANTRATQREILHGAYSDHVVRCASPPICTTLYNLPFVHLPAGANNKGSVRVKYLKDSSSLHERRHIS